jgi:hypothetical protein
VATKLTKVVERETNLSFPRKAGEAIRPLLITLSPEAEDDFIVMRLKGCKTTQTVSIKDLWITLTGGTNEDTASYDAPEVEETEKQVA